MNNTTRIILIIVLLVIFISSSVLIGFIIYDAQRTEKEFDYLDELVELPQSDNTESTPSTPTTSQPSSQTKPTAPAPPPITRNIEKLKEMNSDCIGWVCIPGTRLNYPVMYTPQDAEKYLRKNFYGKYSTGGVPFIDIRCPLDSKNLIIYGHNMKSGSLFGSLRNYLKDSYLKAHPTIEFETAEGCFYYEIKEVRKTTVKDEWYDYNILNTTEGESYLTLSTCYGSNKSDRLIIIAVKK